MGNQAVTLGVLGIDSSSTGEQIEAFNEAILRPDDGHYRCAPCNMLVRENLKTNAS